MADDPSLLAKRMACIDASGIRKVFDLAAKLKNPINLSIGQPDYDVPAACQERAIEAIRAGMNRYTVTQGDAALREAIAADLRREFGTFDGPVLVTSGTSGGLLLAILSTINPGDEVIIPDPYFVMYKHLVNLVGARPVFVDTYPDFRLRADRIEAAVTPRTRLIILNSPTNPTGVVHSEAELRAVIEVARRHRLLVISDEVYNAFAYDGPAASAWPLYDRVLLLRGYSKTYAMTGWRLGYAVGPASILQAMTTLQQYTFVCAPSPFQAAAATALKVDVSAHIAEFKSRRDVIYEGLRERFGLARPEGAFYVFPKAPGGSGAAFCARAIEAGVLIIPGSVFSERDTHFRIAYPVDRDTLRRGIDLLNQLALEMGA